MLNGRGTLSEVEPHDGHRAPAVWMIAAIWTGVSPSTPSGRTFSSTVSARATAWQDSHVTSGSVKFSKWPDARTTASGRISAASMRW